jgi:hypothetical protein
MHCCLALKQFGSLRPCRSHGLAGFAFIDHAIVGLAQPLTEAPNQLASGLRRVCDLIEELGRCEEFCLNLAGGSSGRTAAAVFHNAHLSYNLARADRAEKDALAIEFPEYVNGAAERRKTPSAGSPSLKRTCPSAKCEQVIVVLSTGSGICLVAHDERVVNGG